MGRSHSRFIGRLFPKADAKQPANRVIADADEIRMLRTGMQALTVEGAREFGIPEGALRLLPDTVAFLLARGRWLAEEERRFIAGFVDPPLGAACLAVEPQD